MVTRPLLAALLLFLLGTSCLSAQETPAPAAPGSGASGQRRLFGIGPKFDVTERDNPRPLKPSEKFRLFAVDATRPYQFATAAAVTGISMIDYDNRGFGQGGEGFGKRYGAAMADQASSSFFGQFVFPTLFRQDPRYFRRGNGPNSGRLGYAISRVAVTRGDKGQPQFNASKVLGILCAGALANAYYPESERNVGRTFRTIGINFGTTAGFNVVKEFWPRRKKH